MTQSVPDKGLELRSLVRPDKTVEIFLELVDVPVPERDEVIIRVEAAPINPSDMGLLFGGADMSAAQAGGSNEFPVITAPISDSVMRAMAGRVGVPMAVGNEGAGTVVASGDSPEARALMGKVVAVAAGGMYSQYRRVRALACLELAEGTSARDGASSFVNPMTALGMVGTMRRENHTALVHTAAASNLGQMLNHLCMEEGVPLVNIVRRTEHEELLRAAGASYVCNSSSEGFMGDLIEALKSTSATLAFDAIGGGRLASQILTCMESAASSSASDFARYGSSVHKQVYIYGGLDRGPTELTRSFGMSWGVGGWLLTPFLQRIGSEETAKLRQRVAKGLSTTFASSYTAEVSLAEALNLQAIAGYGSQGTGAKYLIQPNT